MNVIDDIAIKLSNRMNSRKKTTWKQWVLVFLIILVILLLYVYGIKVGCETNNNGLLRTLRIFIWTLTEIVFVLFGSSAITRSVGDGFTDCY